MRPIDESALKAAVLDLASRVIALEKRLCVCDRCGNPLRSIDIMGSIDENEQPNAGHAGTARDT